MPQLTPIRLNQHQRGDSGIIPWSWTRIDEQGVEHPVSLVGYKVSMTFKNHLYDQSTDDETEDTNGKTTLKGFNNKLFKIDIDCDDSTQMSGIDPAKGEVLFKIPKQATWVEPGKYHWDIVVENKTSKITTTLAKGTMEIVGHATNRLTTDSPEI